MSIPQHPVNPEGDLLTVPCGQPYPHQPNFTDLLDSRAQCSVMIRPATIATGPGPVSVSINSENLDYVYTIVNTIM